MALKSNYNNGGAYMASTSGSGAAYKQPGVGGVNASPAKFKRVNNDERLPVPEVEDVWTTNNMISIPDAEMAEVLLSQNIRDTGTTLQEEQEFHRNVVLEPVETPVYNQSHNITPDEFVQYFKENLDSGETMLSSYYVQSKTLTVDFYETLCAYIYELYSSKSVNKSDLDMISIILRLIPAYKYESLQKLKPLLSLMNAPCDDNTTFAIRRPRKVNVGGVKLDEHNKDLCKSIETEGHVEQVIREFAQCFGSLPATCKTVTIAGHGNFSIQSYTTRTVRMEKEREPIKCLEFKFDRRLLLVAANRKCGINNKMNIFGLESSAKKSIIALLNKQLPSLNLNLTEVIKMCSYKEWTTAHVLEASKDPTTFKVTSKTNPPEVGVVFIDSILVAPKTDINQAAYGRVNNCKIFPLLLKVGSKRINCLDVGFSTDEGDNDI